jgi:CO dehydrogenase maturation factor
VCEGEHSHVHDHHHLAPAKPVAPPSVPIIAVCGKGGVGKTALSAALAREFLDANRHPLLLIDADPAGGLVSTLGERAATTLADVRARIIAIARKSNDQTKFALADQIDFLLLEALAERENYSLLPMGLSKEKGCFCPVNRLLRSSIEYLIDDFACILIDAEAGLEQINRQVTARVSRIVVVIDGSVRSLETFHMIEKVVPATKLAVVANRIAGFDPKALASDVPLIGVIPEDPLLAQHDREGRSLWQLPPESPARRAVVEIAKRLLQPSTISLVSA